jgi:hypothetical protein
MIRTRTATHLVALVRPEAIFLQLRESLSKTKNILTFSVWMVHIYIPIYAQLHFIFLTVTFFAALLAESFLASTCLVFKRCLACCETPSEVSARETKDAQGGWTFEASEHERACARKRVGGNGVDHALRLHLILNAETLFHGKAGVVAVSHERHRANSYCQRGRSHGKLCAGSLSATGRRAQHTQQAQHEQEERKGEHKKPHLAKGRALLASWHRDIHLREEIRRVSAHAGKMGGRATAIKQTSRLSLPCPAFSSEHYKEHQEKRAKNGEIGEDSADIVDDICINYLF